MWKWFRSAAATKGPAPASPELKGAPEHARVKTYSAETGYVYQYVYRGYRPMPDGRGMEHVFQANRDRKAEFRVTVHLLDAEVGHCVRAIGRDLIGAERYALVKMSLFAALDEVADVDELEKPVVPGAAQMESYLRTLGRV